MRKTYYEKVGRRYREVTYYDSELFESMSVGSHLVMVYPGGKSVRYNIDAALAPMIAAGRFAEATVAEAIYEASKSQPSKPLVTEEQRQAWKNLSQAFGDDLYSLHLPSARDITAAGVAAMQQEADKLLKNPAVKAAYDQFMLLCELTKKAEETE